MMRGCPLKRCRVDRHSSEVMSFILSRESYRGILCRRYFRAYVSFSSYIIRPRDVSVVNVCTQETARRTFNVGASQIFPCIDLGMEQGGGGRTETFGRGTDAICLTDFSS